MRRVIVSHSQPIRSVRFDSDHAQSDGNFLDRELPVLDRADQKERFLWEREWNLRAMQTARGGGGGVGIS